MPNGPPRRFAKRSLWRGAALADLAYERFAQNEIGRLEELRLAALEERIEADLALGRHDALVAELEALAAQNPYRERLRAQLILALYRAGRQAEALEAYRRARETFVAELGIEPSPRLQELERAILRHDASLEAPAPRVPRPEMRLLGRRRRLFAVAAIGVVLAAAAAAVAGLGGRSATSRAPPALVGNSVVVIDPKTNSVDRELPIGGRPAGIAVGEGSIWVGNRDDKTLLRIDPSTRRIVRTSVSARSRQTSPWGPDPSGWSATQRGRSFASIRTATTLHRQFAFPERGTSVAQRRSWSVGDESSFPVGVRFGVSIHRRMRP